MLRLALCSWSLYLGQQSDAREYEGTYLAIFELGSTRWTPWKSGGLGEVLDRYS